MANMSHCRYRNTLEDLKACYDIMDDEPTSAEEKSAKMRLIKMCQEIAENYGEKI